MKKHFDIGNGLVISATFILFIIALFTTGFTKNLFLEAGVFLVSIKIILMSHRVSLLAKDIIAELNQIKEILNIIK